MKIVYVGAVEIGLTVLEAVYEANGEVELIVTLPPELAAQTSGFVDFGPLADRRGTPLVRAADINAPETVARIRETAPDLIIVCGWQRLVGAEILALPRLGAVGFHSSLLPRYRGRAPVNWAILMGERETGITMFHLASGADDGDIITQRAFPILLDDDCAAVYRKAAAAGAEMVRTYLPLIAQGRAPRRHNESASHPAYPKRTPADGRIDFERSALDVYNFVRALTRPYPGAFFIDNKGRKVKVWKVAIVFDRGRLLPDDIVFETRDLPIRLADYEYA